MWTSKRAPFDASAAALWLEGRVGPVEARQRFADEARAIGVDPGSPIAIRHAIATYTAETGLNPNTYPPNLQEGLLP